MSIQKHETIVFQRAKHYRCNESVQPRKNLMITRKNLKKRLWDKDSTKNLLMKNLKNLTSLNKRNGLLQGLFLGLLAPQGGI